VGTIHYFLIGPYLLPRRLSTQMYRCFWRKGFQKCWRISHWHSGRRVVPAQQGCGSLYPWGPITSHRHLQRSLDWTGLPVAWPPRSPHLTPMGLFLWGHIKCLIFTSPINSERMLLTHL
jgi:hypothetical protein